MVYSFVWLTSIFCFVRTSISQIFVPKKVIVIMDLRNPAEPITQWHVLILDIPKMQLIIPYGIGVNLIKKVEVVPLSTKMASSARKCLLNHGCFYTSLVTQSRKINLDRKKARRPPITEPVKIIGVAAKKPINCDLQTCAQVQPRAR